MESLVKLLFEWEIQLLVIFSFTLQLFLFFTGGLRRRNTNMFLSLSIWISYLGADLVAVYSLGYLSRHEDVAIVRTQTLAFFWAPFLLIHLGGQDTITAFAMEDNNLWLRHLLNLVVQVVLALYVFWKSIGRHSAELLVSGVFVFIAGIIKYGERTWSLQCGSFKSLENSTGDPYMQRLPEVIHEDPDHYSQIVWVGLSSMRNVLDVFAGRMLSGFRLRSLDSSSSIDEDQSTKSILKVLELELGMMYDDLYTKALVLRTRIGIILRCISHISAVVAFVLFLASDKRRYSRADIATTYLLFIGGFFLDLCAMFIFMMSPWTWAWLKARKCDRLARLSWFLFSSDIGWPERKPWRSNSMGQYKLVNWLAVSDQPKTCNQQVMTAVRRLVNLVGVEKEKLFWMSKLLDTEYVEADEATMECVVKGISRFRDPFEIVRFHYEFSTGAREWPKIGPLLKTAQGFFVEDFGKVIVVLHVHTQLHLGKYPPPPSETDVMVKVCRKLSNYMMYLVVAHPSMLLLNASAVATLKGIIEPLLESGGSLDKDVLIRAFYDNLEASKETLEEMVDMWTRLLIYAAGKSRPEAHAALLARGVEPITLAWLLMAQQGLGDAQPKRIRITNAPVGTGFREAYAFYVPNSPAAGASSSERN